ncbi:MAG TPA: ankyrin repeat domain-containing protein, partial [Candidatus Saccharimonadales bacterium]|nr:ankyrin repeat domain-containing protein [Candidatus Saccharimonadales bacterium]
MRYAGLKGLLVLLLFVTAHARAIQQQKIDPQTTLVKIEEQKKTVAANPDDDEAHVKLGHLWFDLQQYDEAEKSYRRALELNPKDPNLKRYLGTVLHNQGQKDEAIRYYREYLATGPDSADKKEIEGRISWLERVPQQTLVNNLLVHAAGEGNLAYVNILIAKGADVNFQEQYEYKKPLSVAAEKGHVSIVQALLAKGAKDENGVALAAAYRSGHSEIEKLLTPNPLPPKIAEQLLYAALRKNDVQRFTSLVDLVGPEERDEVLLSALSHSDKQPTEIVRVLLEKGVNVNQPTKYKTPLMHAADKGYTDIVNLLLARGAQVNVQT